MDMAKFGKFLYSRSECVSWEVSAPSELRGTHVDVGKCRKYLSLRSGCVFLELSAPLELSVNLDDCQILETVLIRPTTPPLQI